MRRLETNDQKEMQGEREKEINEYLHWAKNAASLSRSGAPGSIEQQRPPSGGRVRCMPAARPADAASDPTQSLAGRTDRRHAAAPGAAQYAVRARQQRGAARVFLVFRHRTSFCRYFASRIKAAHRRFVFTRRWRGRALCIFLAAVHSSRAALRGRLLLTRSSLAGRATHLAAPEMHVWWRHISVAALK